MRIYLDTSAMTKIYIQEGGSWVVLRALERATEVVLSPLVIPEFFSALNRRVRDGSLKKNEYEGLKREFFLDIEEARIVDLSSEIIKKSLSYLEKFSLRAFDAVHIATASESECELFITADSRQYDAAKTLKLKSKYVDEKTIISEKGL